MHLSVYSGIASWVVLAQARHIDVAQGADRGGDWGAVFGVLVGGLVLAALIVVGYFVVRFVREKLAAAGEKRQPTTKLVTADIRRRVKKAEDRGDFETAGDLLAEAGAHEEASDAYARAGAFLKAAQSFHATGNTAQAIHFYKRAEHFEQA
ncbi:MAG: hypothetical protein ACOCV2_08040, partial [Persicimonas sp.]